HSGKQTMLARLRAASAIAAHASDTDSSALAGYFRLASATRTVAIVRSMSYRQGCCMRTIRSWRELDLLERIQSGAKAPAERPVRDGKNNLVIAGPELKGDALQLLPNRSQMAFAA